MEKPCTRLDVSQKVLRVDDGYFFFLAGRLLCLLRLLRFLSHVALHNPEIDSMQVDPRRA